MNTPIDFAWTRPADRLNNCVRLREFAKFRNFQPIQPKHNILVKMYDTFICYKNTY